jgi:hypothetical protein
MKSLVFAFIILLITGCKSLNYIKSDKKEDSDLLYNLIIGIYKTTPTNKVKKNSLSKF